MLNGMPRVKSTLNKTSQKKLSDFYSKLSKAVSNIDINVLSSKFNSAVLKDVRGIKEGNEKKIVDTYIQYGEILKDYADDIDKGIEKVTNNVRLFLAGKYTSKSYTDIIDIYFNDVRREYILCPSNASNDLEFLPENKDIFIRNNLKLVVSIAKKYRNFGLPFEDLIQAGNYGLMVAFDRFDANRNTLRGKVITAINESPYDYFSKDDALSLLSTKFTYDNMLSKTEKKIPEDGFESKEAFIAWAKVNVKTAIFASVAYRWIESYIKQELDHNKSTIRFPKIKNDLNEDSPYYKSSNYVISLDSINPYTDDNYNDNLLEEVTQEEFIIEDEKIIAEERNEYFSEVINKVLEGVSNIDKRIIKKRFGIGFPNELSVNEIAESEGLSTSEVKYSISKTMNYIANELPKETKNNILELFT